jgi:hypothetical protein
MHVSVSFGDAGGWDLATLSLIISIVTSLVGAVIAIQVYLIARNIRTLDWYRSQNDAWNAYNSQKLGAHKQAFEAVDAITGGRVQTHDQRAVNEALLDDPDVRAVMFQRMNILERDYKALALNLVDGADGHYLLNEVKRSGNNARLIINFMARGGYDPDYVMFFRRIARWFAGNPHASIRPREARAIICAIKRDRYWALGHDDGEIADNEDL